MEDLGINWKILIGQSINFIILLYLLKRFVYKPFLGMLEKRREGIIEGIKKSEKAEETLRNVRAISESVKEKSEKNAQEVLKKAELRAQERAKEITDLAEAEKQKILSSARIAAEKEAEEQREVRQKEAIEKTFLLTEIFLKEKFTEEKDIKLVEEMASKL